MKPPQYYSRLARTSATQGGNLPHWSQWCATFTTFRLADSLPECKLEQMRAERDEWLLAHCYRDDSHPRGRDAPVASSCPRGRDAPVASGKEEVVSVFDAARTPRPHAPRPHAPRPQTPRPQAPRPQVSSLSADDRAEYRELFSKRFHAWLDAGHGSCIMRDAEARSVVEDTLRHFADVRYSLYAFVVMPNHVHVLFMPEEGFDSREIVSGWKSCSAHDINRLFGRKGALWQKESYDHLVRDVEEFNAYRSYIRQNDPLLAFDAYSV